MEYTSRPELPFGTVRRKAKLLVENVTGQNVPCLDYVNLAQWETWLRIWPLTPGGDIAVLGITGVLFLFVHLIVIIPSWTHLLLCVVFIYETFYQIYRFNLIDNRACDCVTIHGVIPRDWSWLGTRHEKSRRFPKCLKPSFWAQCLLGPLSAQTILATTALSFWHGTNYQLLPPEPCLCVCIATSGACVPGRDSRVHLPHWQTFFTRSSGKFKLAFIASPLHTKRLVSFLSVTWSHYLSYQQLRDSAAECDV